MVAEALAPLAEALGEAFGEAGEEDAALGGLDVVGDAEVGDGAGVRVVDGVGGAPVEVAGLADGAGVDELAGVRGDVEDPLLMDGAVEVGGAQLVPVVLLLGEAALQVGVAEEGEGGSGPAGAATRRRAC